MVAAVQTIKPSVVQRFQGLIQSNPKKTQISKEKTTYRPDAKEQAKQNVFNSIWGKAKEAIGKALGNEDFTGRPEWGTNPNPKVPGQPTNNTKDKDKGESSSSGS